MGRPRINGVSSCRQYLIRCRHCPCKARMSRAAMREHGLPAHCGESMHSPEYDPRIEFAAELEADAPQILRETEIRCTRKLHPCEACGQEIAIGDTATARTLAGAGEAPRTVYTCWFCSTNTRRVLGSYA
jgi:hypothetical protein